MKMNKSILALALGLGLASVASAGTVYMTGSTAARSVVYTTLATAGSVFSPAPTITTYGSTSASGATYMIFSGTLVGGGASTIDCYWSGSEAGISDVATPNTETFADPAFANGALTNLPATHFVTAQVNLAMADNAQAYSRTPTPAVSGTFVGVIPFDWVCNNGNFTGGNVTDIQIRAALAGRARWPSSPAMRRIPTAMFMFRVVIQVPAPA